MPPEPQHGSNFCEVPLAMQIGRNRKAMEILGNQKQHVGRQEDDSLAIATGYNMTVRKAEQLKIKRGLKTGPPTRHKLVFRDY
jgi:hypothetical protein